MKIRYTRKSIRWLARHNINQDKLSNAITSLCNREGRTSRTIKINIRPNALNSDYMYWTDTLNVAVQSPAKKPRYYKLEKMLRNLLHELRHFIQYRIYKKPFAFSYTYRDMQLINDRYWNDPDEIDARKYETKKLKLVYNKLI